MGRFFFPFSLLCRVRLRMTHTTLTRSASEGRSCRPRWRFGLVSVWPVCGLIAVMLTGGASAAEPPAPQPDQAKVDRAVAQALRFLAVRQQASGAWKIESSGESTAATSLAVMAFMAAGHVPGEGPYGERLERAIRWVAEHQQSTGMIVSEKSHGPMYSHGISTLMLAEAIGMVDGPLAKQCRETLQRAVELILKAQNVQKRDRDAGGWRYSHTSQDSDLSVTGWQLLALRAARNVGCDVPAENIDRAVAYVKKCSYRNNQGFGYQPGGGPTPTRTGTGILALEVCGKHHTDEALGGAEYLLSHPLRHKEQYFFYGVYYCTVGMFKVGGKYWEETKRQLTEELLKYQSPDGSWTPTHSGERQAGKIYATSMAVLALAVEYRYLPIYQR